jgi:hypothetical protein
MFGALLKNLSAYALEYIFVIVSEGMLGIEVGSRRDGRVIASRSSRKGSLITVYLNGSGMGNGRALYMS